MGAASRFRSLLLAGLSCLAVAPSAMAGPSVPAHGSSSTPSLGEALEHSNAEQLALSDHLRQRNVMFYGAWWCPASFRQKHLFGKEAGNRLPYVECDKEPAGRERCRAAGVQAYPTWVMGRQRVEGVQSVEELKQWSGFDSRAAAPMTAPSTAGQTRQPFQ